MNLGIACVQGPPPDELVDLLLAAGLPAAPLRGAAAPALLRPAPQAVPARDHNPAREHSPASDQRPAGDQGRAAVSTAGFGPVTWLLAPAGDVFVALVHGALQAAVVGKDMLLELRPPVHELLDLRVCTDALVYATPEARPAADGRARPRVATRYAALARRHFAAMGVQVEPLPFEASILALAFGMADGVLELRSRVSGAELLLIEREEVAACSARLVVGRAARAMQAREVGSLVAALRGLLEEA